MNWQLADRTLEFEDENPRIMGILNVTPDSFSDGGRFDDVSAALEQARKLIANGADIVDVGGESTRPYAPPVSESEELRRVLPVIERLADQTEAIISIDTSKSQVARAAIVAGAHIINDVTALRGDPAMIDVALQTGVGVCAMHMQGCVQDMQDAPTYQNVVQEVFQFLDNRRRELVSAGIHPNNICLDPGIGFGKTFDHNLELLQNAERFQELGCPILIGHSRKRFIGQLLGDETADRDIASAAIGIALAGNRVQILRLHNVAAYQQMRLAHKSVTFCDRSSGKLENRGRAGCCQPPPAQIRT